MNMGQPCCRAICLATLCLSLGVTASAQTHDSKSGTPIIANGVPIAATRRIAIDARPFHRPLDQDRVRKWMEIGSRCTIAEFELFLAPFSEQEEQLVRRIENMQAPIVNRLRIEDLRGVLADGGLLSLDREEALRHGQVKHTTPALENALYGARDCVFASVGPPDGSPEYGDVIIRLKDSVRENGWATPFSGMHFMYAVQRKDARKMQALLAEGHRLPTDPTDPLSLGFDDRLHFSHYIVTENVWEKALAYQAILVLRNAGDSAAGQRIRERFTAMLTEEDADKFWTLFIPSREQGLTEQEAAARVPFGYLEGKFPDQFSIEDFTAIEVPSERLAEVRDWPEAKPYLDLIAAKPAGVP